ncbi:hypothetical protein IE81DRAFT_345071 [Ceraceosorus guamensis]|uniref:Velvet domain-containing protein n=1 Tax=Ceraceosorus guamensis TaxID=1522189 RepID=A0A316W5A5_9BASI|nr:hypothetical protein IE81DRAFT_345071 [Ceraceosorus guamensis]PWN45009.1 hypothetical protein IE81DRAFT_345071 [Ceraceosorus guamensis]
MNKPTKTSQSTPVPDIQAESTKRPLLPPILPRADEAEAPSAMLAPSQRAPAAVFGSSGLPPNAWRRSVEEEKRRQHRESPVAHQPKVETDWHTRSMSQTPMALQALLTTDLSSKRERESTNLTSSPRPLDHGLPMAPPRPSTARVMPRPSGLPAHGLSTPSTSWNSQFPGTSQESRTLATQKTSASSGESSGSRTNTNVAPAMGSSSALAPSSASPWFTCPSVDHTLRIHQGLPPATQVKFQLRIIQQPQEALAVGESTDVHKQARNLPLDPPPVCELVTRDDTFANFLHLPEVSLRAHLVAAAAPHKELLAGPGEQGALINGIHEGAFVAPITDSVTRSFFIFTEIGIRPSGQFRIRFDLVDRAGLSFKHVASVYTDPFTAHSDRNQFSGLQRSSELLRAVARRGLKVRIVDVLPLAFKRRKTEAAATAFRNISAPVSSMQAPAFYPRQRQSDQLPPPLLHSAEDLQTTRHVSYESSPRPMVDTRAIPQMHGDPLRSVDLASRGPADFPGSERTSEANSNRNRGRFSAPIGAEELERVKLPPPNPYKINQHVPRYAQTPLLRASTDLDGGRLSAPISHFSAREEFLGSTGLSGHPQTSASGSRRQTFVDYERRPPSDVAIQDRRGSSSSLDADRHDSLPPSRLQRQMDALPSPMPPPGLLRPADPLSMRDGASIGPDTLPPPSSIFSRVIARPMRELGRYEVADDDARRADLSDDEVHARRLFHARTEGSMAPPAAAEMKGAGGSSTRPQDFEHTLDASHRFRDQSRREGDADVQDGEVDRFPNPCEHILIAQDLCRRI